jgi:hypothetical protein
MDYAVSCLRRDLYEDTTDDHNGSYAETEGLLNSLYINLILFSFFMIFFEANRHMKSTYLKRSTRKFTVGQTCSSILVCCPLLIEYLCL